MEKLGHCYAVDEDVKEWDYYGKRMWKTLKKLKTDFQMFTVQCLGIFTKELKLGSERDICTPTFIATLFIIVKIWKQCKYPSTDSCVNKMVYTYNEILFSFIK